MEFGPLMHSGREDSSIWRRRRCEQPNIIWIFGDQHRGCATGYAGDPNVRTPHLDTLAMRGLRLPRAVAGTPLCSPFRGSLLTGQYPHHCVPGHQDSLPDGMPTVAERFNEAGYQTAWFGKWHIDGYKEADGRPCFHTVDRSRRGGFQQWLGYENNLYPFESWIHGHWMDGTELPLTKLEGFETDALTALFVDFIKGQGNVSDADKSDTSNVSPFFAALSVFPPHDPFTAPEDWEAHYNPETLQLRPNVPDYPALRKRVRGDLARYYAMIENLDHNVGRIISILKETDLFDNTIILFFSDHGEMLGSHGCFRKTTFYEESIRIPFVIGGGYLEGVSQGVFDYVLNHVDISATSLGLCGLDVPKAMEGFNYAPWLLESGSCEVDVPESAFMQYCRPSLYGHCVHQPWRGIVTRDGWKYACFEDQDWMLFNLNDDPFEFVNLANYRISRKQRDPLRDMLREWIARTGDSFQVSST